MTTLEEIQAEAKKRQKYYDELEDYDDDLASYEVEDYKYAPWKRTFVKMVLNTYTEYIDYSILEYLHREFRHDIGGQEDIWLGRIISNSDRHFGKPAKHKTNLSQHQLDMAYGLEQADSWDGEVFHGETYIEGYDFSFDKIKSEYE